MGKREWSSAADLGEMAIEGRGAPSWGPIPGIVKARELGGVKLTSGNPNREKRGTAELINRGGTQRVKGGEMTGAFIGSPGKERKLTTRKPITLPPTQLSGRKSP